MRSWRAVTESGTIYSSNEFGVTVDGTSYRNPILKAIGTSIVTWDKVEASPPVDKPQVGKRIYVLTYGDAGWRISTPVVSLEMLD